MKMKMNQKPEDQKKLTQQQAVIEVAAVLGKASLQLYRSGYSALAIECESAIQKLRDCEIPQNLFLDRSLQER